MIKSTKANQRRISLMDNYTRIALDLTNKNFIPDEDQLEVRQAVSRKKRNTLNR